MKHRSRKHYGAFLCALLICATPVAFAADNNLLKDAGFDMQLPPDQGGWVLFDESQFSSDMARSDGGSMFNWGFSRTVAFPPYLTGTVSGSYQELPARPGSRWRLTGYGAISAPLRGATAFGIIQLSFFDANGNDLGTVETAANKTPLAKTSNKINSLTPAGEWIFLDTGIATAPANTAKIQAFTLYVDYSDSNTSQGVYFDDLSLTSLTDS